MPELRMMDFEWLESRTHGNEWLSKCEWSGDKSSVSAQREVMRGAMTCGISSFFLSSVIRLVMHFSLLLYSMVLSQKAVSNATTITPVAAPSSVPHAAVNDTNQESGDGDDNAIHFHAPSFITIGVVVLIAILVFASRYTHLSPY